MRDMDAPFGKTPANEESGVLPPPSSRLRAAFRLCDGPLVLLADHRPAPSYLPVIVVPDLDAAIAALKARGWQCEGEPFEIPNGTCYRFADPSGYAYALFQNDRVVDPIHLPSPLVSIRLGSKCR
jgi:hypothetical protein